jgi:hypothetical protein
MPIFDHKVGQNVSKRAKKSERKRQKKTEGDLFLSGACEFCPKTAAFGVIAFFYRDVKVSSLLVL